MQLKIIGNKSAFTDSKGTENSVSLTGDITDDKILSALAIVGFGIGQVRGGHEPYDALQSAGVKEQCGTYITNDDLQQVKDDAKREGFNLALPPGHVAYSDAEIDSIRREAFARGQEHAQAQGGTPHNFPIPADVWYGKHYGEFVTISGFANDSIPGASENGYLTKRVYVRKDDITTPGTYTLPPMMQAPVFDPTNEVQCREAQKMHDKLLDDGYVPALVIELR